MSDRTSPIKYDIVVLGKLGPPSMCVELHLARDAEEEFSQFMSTEAGTLWPRFCDMYAFLEQHFNKESGWFVDKFCNNGVMSALDEVCLAVYGKGFGEQNEQEECNRLGIRLILWVAFLAKRYNITEVPEVYHWITP